MKKKGWCKYCRGMIILIDGSLRLHKDKTGSRCDGSEDRPTTPEAELAKQRRDLEENALPILQEIAGMEVGMPAVIKLAKLLKRYPMLYAVGLFVKICSGELGELIRNLTKEQDDVLHLSTCDKPLCLRCKQLKGDSL
jgi:hypothetical protein